MQLSHIEFSDVVVTLKVDVLGRKGCKLSFIRPTSPWRSLWLSWRADIFASSLTLIEPRLSQSSVSWFCSLIPVRLSSPFNVSSNADMLDWSASFNVSSSAGKAESGFQNGETECCYTTTEVEQMWREPYSALEVPATVVSGGDQKIKKRRR